MLINNTHSHFGVEFDSSKVSLKALFDHSYVGWRNQLQSVSKGDLRYFFERNCSTRAFRQLKLSIERLYGKGTPLDENTWTFYDERIKKAYEDPNYQNYVLRNICKYEHILLDDYIDIRNDGSKGVLCEVALRCDFLFYGYSKKALYAAEASPFYFFEEIPDNLEEYCKKIRAYIQESVKMKKCYALKICMAYFRDLAFHIATPDDAKRVYQDPSNPQYIRFFQDFVMTELCNIAREYNLPIQIHTGLGQIYKTGVMNLFPIFQEYPDVKFAILHGSFPWIDDLLAVLYGFPNTYLDICWVPLLSLPIGKNMLINVLELIGGDRVIWGCDTATVEESYGALLGTFELLDEVMEYFITKNFFKESFGEELKGKILYYNAKELFGF